MQVDLGVAGAAVCLLWGAGAAGGNGSRPGLFRHLAADETVGYLAIMDCSRPPCLPDLSAVEVTTQLTERA